MSGTGRRESEDAPEAPQHEAPQLTVTGAWVGYLILALMLLVLIAVDVQFADAREWRSFTGTTVLMLVLLIVPTGGLRWLRRSWQARKPPARL